MALITTKTVCKLIICILKITSSRIIVYRKKNHVECNYVRLWQFDKVLWMFLTVLAIPMDYFYAT